MTKLYDAQWAVTKKMLCEGADLTRNQDGSANSTKKQVMETVLENTRRELKLMENATLGATSAANIAALNKVILPVIRRVMPTVIANEIVGVQPMTGPVAQIHTLRVMYEDTFGGATAGQEALSPMKSLVHIRVTVMWQLLVPQQLPFWKVLLVSVWVSRSTALWSKLRAASCPHVGPSKLHKMHKASKVLTSKQK